MIHNVITTLKALAAVVMSNNCKWLVFLNACENTTLCTDSVGGMSAPVYAWDTVAHDSQVHQIPSLSSQQARTLHRRIGANLYFLPLPVACFPSFQGASSFPKDKQQSGGELGAGAKQAS